VARTCRPASSIISNPDTDPHDYEPTPADGRTIVNSALFVENGVGYDPWAAKTLAASPTPQRVVIDVGKVVGVPEGAIRTVGIPPLMWTKWPMRSRLV
jgi:ABC-type Zn uptake system ZnuABC Zn-binding protein ZnuA